MPNYASTLGGVVAASALVAGTAATLDSHLGFSTDVRRLLRDRKFGKTLMQRMGSLGTKASIFHMFERCDPNAEALWFEGRTYLYRDLMQVSSQLACILQARGVTASSNVVVYMTNSPEMIFTALAISQLGAVPAMINYTLRAETLAHVVKIAKANIAVTSPDLTDYLCQAVPDFETLSLNLGAFSQAASKGTPISHLELQSQLGRPTTAPRTVRDNGAIMYTSGTTGKPKAVAVKNFIFAVVTAPMPEDSSSADRDIQRRTFTCLPLFHGVGFNGGFVAGLASSGCCCLARGFSATNFSRQLVESRATRLVYIGEICRYMLAAPPSKFDRSHSCTVAWGNGLQEDIWNKFRERFGIKQIREFYRSTEGQAKYENNLNLPGGEGKVGFLGAFGGWLEDDTILVKVDDEGALARDPRTGFCIKARRGELGEAIGRVRTFELFNEYVGDKEATERKLVHDVFAKGDTFQRSGDLLVHEPNGWIRFSDRTGDTYRWTGENISAGQVRSFIVEMSQIKDAICYGTKLAGYDGQAGCAAIVSKDASSEAEHEIISNLLPLLHSKGITKAAIPRLVRFIDDVPAGPTFKHIKREIEHQPWDPKANDKNHRLYWLNKDKYDVLDRHAWSTIAASKARL